MNEQYNELAVLMSYIGRGFFVLVWVLVWFFLCSLVFFFFKSAFQTPVKLSVFELHQKLSANNADLLYCSYYNLLLLNIIQVKNLLGNAMAHVAKAYSKISKCFVSRSSRQLLLHYSISKPENCKCQQRLFLVRIFKLRPSLGSIACLLPYLFSQYLNTFMLERLQQHILFVSGIAYITN